MRYVCPTAAVLLALTFLAPSMLFAQDGAAGLSIDKDSYQFVSEQRLTRTQWYVTYRAVLVNTGVSRASVVATLTSLVSTVKTVDGQSTLHFAPAPANSRVTSTDTFTILVDRSVTFDFANLKWLFVNPVANPGPDQSGPVGTTINLSGSASTNPSGVGTLSYSWAFASKPVGSNATLTTPHNIASSFVIDLPGTYVINLTVDNGTAQDTRSVTVSTINSPPVAKAGSNQTVAAGATVNLNGSGSFDVDGDPLTYTWTFVSIPPGSNAGNAGIANFKSVTASFVADVQGTYIVQLVVNDGKVDSSPSMVTINAGPAANTPPVANAGPNQSGISVGSTVQLDGSGSTDVNSDPLTYKWTLITIPSGSTAQLSNASHVKPTFVADKAGTYVAQLIVNDGKIDSAPSTVTITTTTPIVAPTANAGANQTVVHGTTVTLDGSGSTDPQNLPLTYSWSFNSKPAGSSATLSNNAIAKPTFVADKPGSYVLQLIVNNGTLPSLPATVTITTTNTPPVANPGANQTVTSGSVVNLNGGGSTDADNDPLTYLWSFTSVPNGSSAALSAATSTTPTFVADLPGTYVVQLIVNDGFASSDPKTVTITVNGPLAITTAALPDGNVSSPYTFTVQASGGVTPYAWSATGLPANLSINSATGQITGTSNASGTSTVNVTVMDSSSPKLTAAASFSLKINQGTPASIAVSSGSGQSAKINAAFANPLKAIVKDANGNPVSGVTVTFTAPVGGASGSFAGNQITAVTDASGIATSAIFTANATVGTYSVAAGINSGAITTNFSLTNTVGDPASIAVSSGSPQSAKTGAAFALPLKAIVQDAGGNAVPNVSVTFTAPASGASGTFAGGQNTAAATTDANGIATSPVFTANPTTGAYTVSAAAGALSANPGFSLTNTQGDPASIAVVSGSGQSTKINTAFGNPLKAVVKDANNNLLAGITVTFTAPGSGASVTFTGGQNTTVTDANGVATSAAFTANGVAGAFSITATAAAGVTTTFALTNLPGDAASITAVSGTPQTATAGAPFAAPLKVLVKDSAGNPVGNAVVTFTAPASGASGTFAGGQITATATTDATGFATSAAFTANTTAGGPYTVSATLGALSAGFSLTNNPDAPASIAVVDGSAQSAPTNTAFAKLLKAVVKDQYGNPVGGVTVTFTALPVNGASGTFANNQAATTAVTDATGIATSSVLTANAVPGNYTVTATGTNLPTVSFLLTNIPGTVTSLTVTGGTSPQSTLVNTLFPSVLKVLAKDANGNPVNGATVNFAAPASGPSGTFLGGTLTATTDVSGVASSVPFSANCIAGGPYTVTATVANTNVSTSFQMTNVPGQPAALQVVSGSNQSAATNTAFPNPLKAAVADACGNLLRAVDVTFTGPSSGAGVTFPNGTNQTIVTTDSAGVATSPTVQANGTQGGPYNVTASVTGVAQPANFALTNTPCTTGCGGVIAATNATIGKNLQDTITITLNPPAPEGLPLTITSRDPSKALVGNAVGSFITNLLAGTTTLGTTVQALTDTGQVILDITAPNYSGATATITFARSGFVISGPNGIGAAFDAFQASTTQLTVFAARLDAQGIVAQTQQVRIGLNDLADNTSGPFTVRVPVSTNVPTVGTLAASFVTFNGGSNSATVNFVASSANTGATDIMVDNTGTSLVCSDVYLQAGKICPPATFTTPTTGNKVTATVKAGSLVPFSGTVGKNLEKAVHVGLAGGAKAPANVTITVTSTDPTKVKFAKKSTDAGSASIDVTIPLNFTNTQDFYVQAFDSTGSVPYTISSTLYGTSGGTVQLGPSGFAIESPAGFGAANFTVQVGGGNPNINVHVGLISGGILTESQLVVPGVTIPVTVDSSNTAVGTITTSPINITAGTESAATQFHPVATGTTTITASSAGYQPAQVAASVTTQKLLVSQGLTVGKFLQDGGGYVILSQPAPSGGTQVTVQSNSPSLKLSTTQDGAGSDTIIVTVPQNTSFGGFWVQSLSDTGSGTFTANATGFASATGTVSFAPSSIVIYPDTASGSVNTTNSTVSIFPVAVINGGLSAQQLAGGQPLNVTVHTTNAAIASVPDTVTIPAGGASVTLSIDLKAVGGATISIDQPAGFTTPQSFTTTTVTVNP